MHHAFNPLRRAKALLFALATLLVAGTAASASAAIALDATSSRTANNGATVTWWHTVGAGDDRILLVAVSLEDTRSSVLNVSRVTYGKEELLPVPGAAGSVGTSELNHTQVYYLLNPPEGRAMVSVKFGPRGDDDLDSRQGGAVNSIVAGAVSLTGVDQVAPTAVNTAVADGSSIDSLVAATSTGTVLVNVVGSSAAGSSLTPDGNDTVLWSAATKNASGLAAITDANLGNNLVGATSSLAGALVQSVVILEATDGVPIDFSLYGFATIDALPLVNATGLPYNDTRAGSKVTTGGGDIDETDSVQYRQVTTANEFGAAIGDPTVRVIEVMNDIDLTTYTGTSSNVSRKSNQALEHPDLIGKTVFNFRITSNKTVFSKNGAFLRRGCVEITNQHNIIVRNLRFGEIWEWDETDTGGEGFLKWNRNDWDGLTITNSSHHVWVDHCTFDITYDGQLDVKNGSDLITLSWSKFQGDPIRDLVDDPEAFAAAFDSSWFGRQYNALAADLAGNPQFAAQLIGPADELATKIAFARKWAIANKGNLWGSSDSSTVDPNHLNVTYHHSWSQNVKQRTPRARFGNIHVLSNFVNNTGDAVILGKESEVLVERTFFLNTSKPMPTNGNGAGRAVDSFSFTGTLDPDTGIVTLNGPGTPVVPAAVAISWHPIANATWWTVVPGVPMEDNLPYPEYSVPETVDEIPSLLVPFAGAGKVSLDWLATTY